MSEVARPVFFGFLLNIVCRVVQGEVDETIHDLPVTGVFYS